MKRFPKTLSTILLSLLLAISLVGCQSAQPVESVPEIVVPEAAPVVDQPSAAQESVAAEEVAVVEEAPSTGESAPAAQPITGTLSAYGYTVGYSATVGRAVVTYPANVIYEEDIAAFAQYINERHGDLLDGVTFDVVTPGVLVLTYPEGVSVADGEAVINMLAPELDAFIASYLAAPSAQEAAAPAEEAPATVAEPITGTLSAYGYSVSYSATVGTATVTYPADVIYEEDIAAFAQYIYERHADLLDGVYFEVTAPGTLVITYPEAVTVADGEAVINMLAPELDAFIASYLAAPAAEEAATVVEEPVAAAEESAAAAEPETFPFGVTEIVKATGDDTFDLFVVHTNDVHGRIEEGTDGSLGYAKLSTLLKMGRSVTDNILVLDAGDVLHGTNLANVFEGESVGQLLAMLGYDAVAPGNHDFNYGADRLIELADMSSQIGGPVVLAANILDGDGNLVFQPYQVYDFNGFDVVVIGLSTPDTKTKSHPKNTEGLTFWDDSYTLYAQQAIDLANEIGDYVIVLGHIGMDADGSSGITSDWICSNLDGIDLFVDGHSHTVLENGQEVNGTLIVSTGQYMNNIGLVQVSVVDGVAQGESAMLIPASEVIDPSTSALAQSLGISHVADDPEVTAFVAQLNAELEQRFSQVVASVPMDLDGEREHVRTGVTNLSSLICQAMTAETGADFTIVNGGGIRASIPAGPVTLGDINNVLPFTNTVAVCEITGAQVLEALEFGYSLLPETNGAFSQSDLQVVYSSSNPAGERIVSVSLPDGTPLDVDATYTVATNDFMAAGGDGYTMFGRVVQEGRQLNEVFADYLASVYPAE